MLENGADIRFIQAMLGHASLETTEIYTRVSIQKLRQIHDATHPANKKPDADDEDAQGSDGQDAAVEPCDIHRGGLGHVVATIAELAKIITPPTPDRAGVEQDAGVFTSCRHSRHPAVEPYDIDRGGLGRVGATVTELA